MSLLAAEGLTVGRGGARVVDGVDLELRDGEVVALMGPNGAGKSTLLAALGGLLPAAGGRVRSEGRIALVLQSPDVARRSVRANVELALRWWGVPPRERGERTRTALAALRVDGLADRLATELSGGERRRVHLARAAALRPEVLLLDEPFAGLDALTRAELLDDASSALRTSARATLVVVHDRAEAWALADRLLVLLDGRVAAAGAPRELLEAPPTPEVARFLGFDGELRQGDRLRLTRPAHVVLGEDGERGTVTRLIPLEDGVRVEVGLAAGRVYASVPLPGPGAGDTVRVTVRGGVTY
jgi:ABC-type nitrate/sulfonate/bicarbonate transport system ATPase subunit